MTKRKIILRKSILTIALFCIGCLQFSYAGWIVTGRYINAEGKTYLRRFFIEGNNVKFEQYNFLYSCNMTTGKLIIVDIDKMIYTQTTLETYKQKVDDIYFQRVNNLVKHLMPNENSNYDLELAKPSRLIPIASDSIRIIDMKDSSKLLGLKVKKYEVFVGEKKVEEFYFSNQKKCFQSLDIDKFNELQYLMHPEDKTFFYTATDAYKKFTKSGLIIRRFVFNDNEERVEYQINKYENKKLADYEFGKPNLCKQISIDEWLKKKDEKTELYDDYE